MPAVAVEPVSRFELISLPQGLSQVTVSSIVQDQQGFIWFATHDGLNRYDGYNIKVFRHDPKDPHSLVNNLVSALYVDTQGMLWVGTYGGLNRFDPATERFQRFVHHPNDEYSLSHNEVRAITADAQGRLWIGTYGGGVNWYDRTADRFHHFGHDLRVSTSLSDNRVLALVSDHNNQLWIGTQKGLARLSLPADINAPISGVFVHYRHDQQQSRSLSDDQIYSLLLTRAGQLWVGTANGLNQFNETEGHFHRYFQQPENINSLSDSVIRAVVEDHNGLLWIGTENGGINRFDHERHQFGHYRHQNDDPTSIIDDYIYSIYQDNQGLLWFGTYGGGVNKLDVSQSVFHHYKHQPSRAQSLSNNAVRAVLKDREGKLWVGTKKGLNVYGVDNQEIRHYFNHPNQPESLSHDAVYAIYQRSDGVIWLGTPKGLSRYHSGNDSFEQIQAFTDLHVWLISEGADGELWLGTYDQGLIRYHPDNGNITRYRHVANEVTSLSDDRVFAIRLGQQGQLWVGSYNGLNRLEIKTGKFKRFIRHDGRGEQPSEHVVLSILNDTNGVIWLGSSIGLQRFDSTTETFQLYDEADGLSNNVVYGVLEGQPGQLWLSTNKGLSRFDISTESFDNFDVNDGVQSNEFNSGAYSASIDGELFFGGINGFNRFYPQEVKINQQLPVVVFSEFLLVNQSVPIKHESQKTADFSLNKAINHLEELVLTHHQPFVSFEFAALHYSDPGKNQYAYKLEGLNEQWIYTDGKHRRATYTNLPAGDYTLRVKASNHHGVWDQQGKALRVTVLPPPWRSWWAYGFYALLVLGVSLAFVRDQQQKVEQERRVVQRLTELDQLKDDFLANTSHELRTPLNGIIGLAESLLDGVRGEQSAGAKKDLAMVVSSGKRLANLINDILDFSKLKNRHLQLNLMAVDLFSMVDVVLMLDRVLLGNKKIKLTNGVAKDLPAVWADENRLAQILHNLVGNAIKFTEVGEVSVTAVQDGQQIRIMICDTGIGIAADKLDSIFTSFEQVEGHVQRGQSGTGLGLSVTKQLVELHGGKIEVNSTLGKGSCFGFSLAVSDAPAVNLETRQLVSRLNVLEQPTQKAPSSATMLDGKPWRVLVVDDEPINRQVLNNHLAQQAYQLVEAASGQEALMAIEQQGPFDLVLLDIMMPKLSGYEVCAKLRQNHSACNLPVIFLTAKNQVDDMVHSFEVGGNDYLSKPVSKQELLTRVETHLKFLDIHRNLEDKVAERTGELENKNRAMLETQQQLVQSEKMAALGTLTAGVAHEINNPTNFVYISSENLVVELTCFQQFLFDLAADEADEQILASFKQKFEPLFEYLSTIREGTERIKDIVKDLRAFTQLDSADCKTVVITDLIETTVNLVRTQYQTVTEFEFSFSAKPAIDCYPAQLNQVLMNLIVNACHAIETRQQQRPGSGLVAIGCEQYGQWVEVTIKDNGCGMSEQTKAKLFEPFYTTKEVGEGTGLGLSIAFGIVEKHAGELTVESALGQGALFRLRLPLTHQQQAQSLQR